MDVRRECIPLLWSTEGQTALGKGFCSNMGNTKYPCIPSQLNTVRERAKLRTWVGSRATAAITPSHCSAE